MLIFEKIYVQWSQTPVAFALYAFINVDNFDDSTATADTSCGIPLKTLLHTPMYCDGSTLVMLTPLPGGASGSGMARSLFGVSANMAGFKCKYIGCGRHF